MKDRVLIVTAAMGTTPDQQHAYMHKMINNLHSHQAYADKYGYHYYIAKSIGDCEGAPGFDDTEIRPFSWYKLPLLASMAADWDWVLWVDADTRVCDDAPPLDVFIDRLRCTHHAILVALSDEKVLHLQCGVMLIRGGRSSLALLKRLWDQRQFLNHCWWEQAAMNYLFTSDLAFAVNIYVLPVDEGNQLQRLPNRTNVTGGLLIHYAGEYRNLM